MPKRAKVTPAIIPQIALWLEQGLCAKDIAKQIGCTYGTLRVRCSQLGISLRRRGNPRREIAAIDQEPPGVWKHIQNTSEIGAPSIRPHHVTPGKEAFPPNRLSSVRNGEGGRAERLEQMVIALPEGTAQQLRARGLARRLSSAIFASMLLRVVVQDDLFDAVLDDGLGCNADLTGELSD